MCTALLRRCTRSVHAVNGSDGHIHATYTAVHTGRKHGRVHGHGRTMYMARARPCTQSVHDRGRVHAVYMVRPRPCTDCSRPPVQSVYTAVHGPCTWPSVSPTRPCTQPVRGKTRPGTRPVRDRVRTVYTAVHRPCTVYTAVYTAVFTALVHGRVRTMYTAVHGPSMTRTRPCTRSCTLYTAVFTARVQYTARKRPCIADGHGHVYGPCMRPCTVYMHVFAACVYSRPRPCTDCARAMYMVRS